MSAMQSDQNQSSDHKRSSGRLRRQRPRAKIFLEPVRPPLRNGVGADKNNRVTHAGDRFHQCRSGPADCEHYQKRSYPCNKAIHEVPESVLRRIASGLLVNLLPPGGWNQQRKRADKRTKCEEHISRDKICMVEHDLLQNRRQAESSRGDDDLRQHFLERLAFGEKHDKSASGHDGKSEELPTERTLQQGHGNQRRRNRAKAAHRRQFVGSFTRLERPVIKERCDQVQYAGGKPQSRQLPARKLEAEGNQDQPEDTDGSQPENIRDQVLRAFSLKQNFVPNEGDANQPMGDDGDKNSIERNSLNNVHSGWCGARAEL